MSGGGTAGNGTSGSGGAGGSNTGPEGTNGGGGGGGGGYRGGGGGGGIHSGGGPAAAGGGGSGFGPAGTVFETDVRSGDGEVTLSWTVEPGCAPPEEAGPAESVADDPTFTG